MDKDEFRRHAQVLRDGETDRPRKSEAIRERLGLLPEYQHARVVASYIGIGSEVGTRDLVSERLSHRSATSVVYREGNSLELAFLNSLGELAQGTFGLWEPMPEIRQDRERHCPVEEVDLFLVPGLAFDRHGGRIGYGRGFYDRLLATAGPDAVFLGLAFECQMVSKVPTIVHDVAVHLIVTEADVYHMNRP